MADYTNLEDANAEIDRLIIEAQTAVNFLAARFLIEGQEMTTEEGDTMADLDQNQLNKVLYPWCKICQGIGTA